MYEASHVAIPHFTNENSENLLGMTYIYLNFYMASSQTTEYMY